MTKHACPLPMLPLIGSCLILCLVSSAGRASDDSTEKLDEGLAESVGFQPVFVRMEDQLFRRAGDYEAFCRQNESVRRSVLRGRVRQTLQSKAEQSWDRIKDRVAQLEAKGQLKEVTRFWIINGFAGEATSEACRVLAGETCVAFVYKQRGPEIVRQHRKEPDRSAGLAGGEPKAIDELPAPQRERLLAQLKEKGIDPSQVRVRIGSPADALPSDADQKAAIEQLLAHFHSDVNEPFSADGLEIPWNLKMIKADQVWEREGVVGKGAVIALNDGGIVDIPSLRTALWRNEAEQLNGKDDDGDGYIDDIFGYNFAQQSGYIFDSGPLNHGTICAGIAAGRPLPEKPLVTGVAPRAQIMPVNGMGYLKAYEYALAHGADVLSMSYMWVNMELGHYRGVFRTAAEHLSAGGVLPVGGAGNFAKTAPEGKQICLPKDIPCVVAVAGVSQDGTRPEFSSQGPCHWDGVRFYDDYGRDTPLRKPDLAAPAGGFPCWHKPMSNMPAWKQVWDGEASGSLVIGPMGNSFAGPHAAGVAALVFSANPELNAWQVKRVMEETSEDRGDSGPDYQFGAGLLQALEAVRAAKKIDNHASGIQDF